MALTKLSITPFIGNHFAEELAGRPYSVMINPEKINHSHDTESRNNRFFESVRAAPEQVTFELVLDTTGVVDEDRLDLTAEVTQLKNTFFSDQRGRKCHNLLQIAWGSFLFRCFLSQMDITYTLFSPNGNPVRAKVHLCFEEYTHHYLLPGRRRNRFFGLFR